MMNPSRIEDVKQFLVLLEQARGTIAQERLVQVRSVPIPLAAITTTTPYAQALRGYGLIMPSFGQPAGAALRVKVDGVEIDFQPGAKLLSPFQRCEVFNTASGANAGSALLYVLDSPDADLELGALTGGNAQAASRTAAHNVTSDIPTLPTDGVLLGGRGVRAIVSSPAASTITSGTGVWWLYDDITGIWAESPVQVDLARTTARRGVSTGDEFTTVARGRAFLEIRSGVNSAAGVFTVNTFGN